MVDITLDRNGDIAVSENGDISLTESICQAVQIRLKWIKEEWRRRGQLRKHWLPVYRRGKRTWRSVCVEAQFPVERNKPGRTGACELVARYEVHNLPLATLVTDGYGLFQPR